MVETYFLFIIGSSLMVFNKPFGNACWWWQEEVY